MNATILVVEDNEATRKVMRVALVGEGYSVVEAHDGASAVEQALAHAPSVVLLDVKLPDADGRDVARRMRASRGDLPIVAVTGWLHADDPPSSSGEFVDIIVKPVDLSRLLATVARYTGRSRADRLEGDASTPPPSLRASMQANALAVLDRLSTSLSRQLDPESALTDTLSECLDAAGLSVGAILLVDSGGFSARAQVGASLSGEWNDHREVFGAASARGGLALPSREAPGGEALIAMLGAKSGLVVPIVARDETLGVLVLASNDDDLAGVEGASLAAAARSLSMQLGQALALGRAFSRLVAAEQRTRVLLENARDLVAVLSTDGTLLEINRRGEELMAARRDLLLGKNTADFVPPEEREAHRRAFRRMVDDGGAPPRVVPFRRGDGGTIQLELSRTVVELGAERAVLTIGRDVDERLKLEEQLRQAQKMEAIGRLAGGIAHDFNNILSVILTYGDLILADLKQGDPLHADVAEIVQAGRRAEALTRQLLMFSRQQVVAPKVLDLNELLTGMDKMLTRILGEDIELVTRTQEDLGAVRVDPGSIEQLVMNLVVNARDAMPTGGKLTLETANVLLDDGYVRAHAEATAGPHVMLAVTDTGVGMDAATQARIFEPFFTTKGTGKGTGLGLSTVFGIVKQSGGTIWVYSEPGRGTTFKVYFPRIAAPTERHGSAAPSGLRGGTEVILLVEDNAQVREAARVILRKWGYTVIEARTPEEAVLLSQQHAGDIDALLTDVVMPQMSGPELAKRLTRERPRMKVLCMSGYTDDSIVRHGLLSAEIAYLQKPITPDSLLSKLREVLDAPRA